MLGQTDKLFVPNKQMTRAEFAMIISRILGQIESDEVMVYKDVKGEWYAEAIQKASAAHILQGYPDGTFKPNAPISRAEILTSLARMMDYLGHYEEVIEDDVLDSFTDGEKVPAWAKDATVWAITYEFMGGYPDGTLGLNRTVTRAETARILENVLKQMN